LVYRLLSSPEKWLKAEYKKLREAQKQVKRLVIAHVISSIYMCFYYIYTTHTYLKLAVSKAMIVTF